MTKLKRFLVFAGDDYYPSGGWGDFRGSYDTLEEALASCVCDPGDWTAHDWMHVIDAETMEKVASSGSD
jgi:hypothetical protein